MNLQELRQLLKHPKPHIRLVAIHVIGMADEVRLLEPLARQLQVEDIPKVAQEFRTVGRQLQQLAREGYNTLEAICKEYNIYSDVLRYADENEFKAIRNIAEDFASGKRNPGMGKALTTATMLAISPLVGVGAVISLSSNNVDISSNMGSVAEMMHNQKKRIRPAIPTDKDISRWAKMLKLNDVDKREQALVQMNVSKNPKSLQYMAYAHYNDSDERVRFRAKQLGRSLYWNTIYYEMEQNGTIEKIMRDFALSMGIALPEDATATQEMPMPEIAQESIADILAKAEKSRKKRGRRR